MMIKSPFLKPLIFSFKSSKPVSSPTMPLFTLFFCFSNSSKSSPITSCVSLISLLLVRFVILKISLFSSFDMSPMGLSALIRAGIVCAKSSSFRFIAFSRSSVAYFGTSTIAVVAITSPKTPSSTFLCFLMKLIPTGSPALAHASIALNMS